ncbi:MAG: DUF58 domain-containing protein [Chloroflexota bacterium]
MWWRKRATEPTTEAASYTATQELSATFLSRLQWTVLRPLAQHLGGSERSLIRGPGIELSEVREYQPGDDIRHIDWNITARTDQPHVREAYVDRALDVWLVLDMSASVDWGTAQCLKRDRALEFAAVIGQLLGRHGNRVGALLFADQPLPFVRPTNGRAHILQILSRIREEQATQHSGVTDLAAALTQFDAVVRRRALVIIMSDFLVPDNWHKIMLRIAQRHETVAVRLYDPREADLPDIGLVTLEDPETGSQFVANTRDRKLRERFRQAAQEQTEQIRKRIMSCGVDYLLLRTDQELLPTMMRFLGSRRERRTMRGQQRAE